MPTPRDASTKHRLSQQAQCDTAPEILLRRELFARGLRYRVGVAVDPRHPRRRADIVFSRVRVAVFVDGCCWHSCPDHGTLPKNNRVWWQQKLYENRERDRETSRSLEQLGWKVIRVWEHESAALAAERIARAVRERR